MLDRLLFEAVSSDRIDINNLSLDNKNIETIIKKVYQDIVKSSKTDLIKTQYIIAKLNDIYDTDKLSYMAITFLTIYYREKFKKFSEYLISQYGIEFSYFWIFNNYKDIKNVVLTVKERNDILLRDIAKHDIETAFNLIQFGGWLYANLFKENVSNYREIIKNIESTMPYISKDSIVGKRYEQSNNSNKETAVMSLGIAKLIIALFVLGYFIAIASRHDINMLYLLFSLLALCYLCSS